MYLLFRFSVFIPLIGYILRAKLTPKKYSFFKFVGSGMGVILLNFVYYKINQRTKYIFGNQYSHCGGGKICRMRKKEGEFSP